MPHALLREHQYELATLDGSETFVFGTEETGYLTLTRPQTEAGDMRTGDRDRPQEDGRQFGRDWKGAKNLVFEIGVLTDHLSSDAYRANLDHIDALEVLWDEDRWRETPDAMAVLRSCQAGQTWRAYGRPRRFEEVTDQRTVLGYSTVIADFPMIDSQWYSDDENTVDITIGSPSEGGLSAPLSAPLSTVAVTAGVGALNIGGSAATWPVVTFYGPITKPRLTIGNLVIGLDMDIPDGEAITYDPSPWVRWVYRESDGAGFGGAVAMVTPRMAKAKIRPGQYEAALTGLDPSGSASVRVRWRDARKRP